MLWYDDRTIVTFLALLFIICRAGVVRVAISHNEVLRKENRSMAMEFGGTQTIAAPVPQVWAFLMDVNNVAECAPGFQSLEVLGDEHWKATISVGVGPVKARFVMDVTRPEVQEPEHMLVKGRGKAPGSAVDLSGDMRLSALIGRPMSWSAGPSPAWAHACSMARLIV
jgi:hypothetical protein